MLVALNLFVCYVHNMRHIFSKDCGFKSINVQYKLRVEL
jgi:hypothetical protein